MMDNSMPMPGDEPDSSETEIPVKLQSLAVQGTLPGVGAECTFTVKGKVSKIDGDVAYVTPESANGEPLPKGTGQPEDMEGKLDRMASAADDAGSSPGGEDTSTY